MKKKLGEISFYTWLNKISIANLSLVRDAYRKELAKKAWKSLQSQTHKNF